MSDLNQKNDTAIMQELVFSFSLADIMEVGDSAIEKSMDVFVLFGIDFDSKIWATLNTESSLKSFGPRCFAQQLKFKIPSHQLEVLIENVKRNFELKDDSILLDVSLGISSEQKVEINFWIGPSKNKIKIC